MTQSADRTWRGLPPERDDAAGSTVEALMLSLRSRGSAALTEQNCQRRLADLSPAQVQQIIARLTRLQPKYPAINDELIVTLKELIK
jgi:hypothetical protein